MSFEHYMESVREFFQSNPNFLIEPHIKTRIIILINPSGIKSIRWEREQRLEPLGSLLTNDAGASIDFNIALNSLMSVVEEELNQSIKKKYGKLEITFGGV